MRPKTMNSLVILLGCLMLSAVFMGVAAILYTNSVEREWLSNCVTYCQQRSDCLKECHFKLREGGLAR